MEALLHIQGNVQSQLTPLFLFHAISGLVMPYFALGDLGGETDDGANNDRPVYGINSPTYQYKGYRLPHSLEDLAREYIALIKREIQFEGPYLLGGWSMGGMVAMKVAAILEAQGEEVLHVLLIDSANPETIPPFVNAVENDILTSLTYNNIARRMNLPTRSGTTNGHHGSSSEDEKNTSNEDEEVGLEDLLPRMRRHVANGLNIIGNVQAGTLLPDALQAPVTLIKCSSLAKLPATMSDARKAAIRKNFHDGRSGWKIPGLQTARFDAQHDSAFDRLHAGDLTAIMTGVLQQVKR
ncbi:hypothetical protein MMC17_000595 [Xylographa soralifera]|nr:hypothetical protein [Xylographa soralifera]